jgi:hypothetical protein
MNKFCTALLAGVIVASASVVRAQTTAPGSTNVVAEPATAATAPAPAPPSNTVSASRTIHLTQRDGRPDTNETWMFLQNRAAELGRELLGIDDGNVSDWCRIEPVIYDGGIDFRLMLMAVPPKPAAKEFMDGLVDALDRFARADFDQQRRALVEPQERLRVEAMQRAQDAQQKLSTMRAKARAIAQRADVSSRSLAEALTRLEEERQKLELDVMGKTARREALEKQVAEQTAAVEKKAADDPVAVELQKVVEARQVRVTQLEELVRAKAASQAEVQEAVGAVAEARAKLLERQRDVAGGDAIAASTRELLALSIDLRELTARLDYVNSHLEALRSAAEIMDDAHTIEAELADARAEQKSAEDGLRAINRRRMEPPKVSVTASENRRKGEKAPGSPERSLFGSGGGGGGGGGAPATHESN